MGDKRWGQNMNSETSLFTRRGGIVSKLIEKGIRRENSERIEKDRRKREDRKIFKNLKELSFERKRETWTRREKDGTWVKRHIEKEAEKREKDPPGS